MVRIRDLAVIFACCAWCAGLFPGRAATARAEALRGVMRVAEPADEVLLERVRGQVGDLDVSLRGEPTEAIESTLREQLETARALARDGDLQVVIWAVRRTDQLEIVVNDLALDRVLVRALQRADTRDERSARDEAAALVVRSALKGSMAGAALGATPTELLSETSSEGTPVEPPAPVIEQSAAPPPERAEPKVVAAQAWLVGAGAWLGADGPSVGGMRGLSARAAWLGPRFELGLRGALGLFAEIDEPRADLRLAQHRLSAQLGWAPLVRARARLSLLAGAGVAIFATRVDAARADFEAREARRALVLLDATVALTLTPGWARLGRVQAALLLEAGAAFFVQPLELGFRTEEGFVRAHRAWAAQPQGGLSLALQF